MIKMLILTCQVNCAGWHIPGITEALAMFLEKWGDWGNSRAACEARGKENYARL